MPSIRVGALCAVSVLAASPVLAQDHAQAFQPCAACHSLEPGRQMTGPSLAGLWGRKAGSLAEFPRYSPALKSSGIAWDEDSLDAWLADPRAHVPGNYMIFPGIKDTHARAALIAYLKTATAPDALPQTAQGGGMGGMMQATEQLDLKTLGPDHRLASLRYCGDTYTVTTASGKSEPMWEFNLRLKTDSSDKGPAKGQPVIVPSGMVGDRASVVFAEPAEISGFIEKRC
jgi:cytochrome c